MKAIAFYLPQFHSIPENDKWWGKGFTEWDNVISGKPLFDGHDQPRIPTYFGYYNLRSDVIREKQASLAYEYGLYGFCYYYYWFSGKKLLDYPLERLYISKKPDFPFCICYANEHWTRGWIGEDKNILIKQEHTKEDDLGFIHSIIPMLKDKRYIRINDRPLLLVYRFSLFSNPLNTIRVWKKEAKKAGINDLYICACITNHSFGDPLAYGFDAIVEFPPHGIKFKKKNEYQPIPLGLVDSFNGYFCDYKSVVEEFTKIPYTDESRVFKTAMLAWDNTARRHEESYICLNFKIELYQKWLKEIANKTRAVHKSEEQIIFINAWNEWGEGTYLEPDETRGFKYLEATKKGLADDYFFNS